MATSDWHAVSDCGRYHVSRARLGAHDHYDAWRGTLASNDLEHLHGSRDKYAAMQACVDHASHQQTRLCA
jgi:hypothetical protein